MSQPGARRRFRRVQALVPVVLVGYLLIAWAEWYVPDRVRGEIFPFFNWDLFSTPRVDGRLYTVRITSVSGDGAPAADLQGETLDDPHSVAFLRDVRFQKTASSLGRAYLSGNAGWTRKAASQLANFLRPQGVTGYDLVMLEYHPLRYYRGEEEAEVKTIASFEIDP